MSALQYQFKTPSNLDDEILKYHSLAFEGQRSQLQEKSEGVDLTKHTPDYEPLKYATNYVSVLSRPLSDDVKERIRLENEIWLKKYYMSKKLINHATLRHGSVASSSDISVAHSDRSKSNTWMNKFLDNVDEVVDPFDLRLPLEPMSNDSFEEEREKRQTIDSNAASSYFNHYHKLLTVDVRQRDVLKRHTLWMPTMRKEFRSILRNQDNGEGTVFSNKLCPLFMEGTNYIPKEYDTYGGCTMIPSLFSEYKLPAFCYHCAVEINDHVYIVGGLIACHKYDEEAPNLQNFEVDGVKNLPPPLLPKIINNPSMISNARLYVMSVTSSHVMRPEISGSIPPPLLCMRGSKLTERYIFFYGGFEIKTEATCDADGVHHLKKRAFVNNTGYILDTITFKFSKIELMALPYKFVTYPTLAARFGHMQMSIMTNHTYCNHTGSQKSSDANEFPENEGSPSDSASMLNSPAMSSYSSPRNCNTNHGSGVYTIIIFGGYRQTGDDYYEAMNDLWKVEVPVVIRGKKGYYKFGDTANATLIPRLNGSDPWPSCRAFFGYSLAGAGLLAKSSMHDGLLEKLYENFQIDSASASATSRSKPIFPNIPHARKEAPPLRQHNSAKDTRSSSFSSMKNRLGSPLQSSCTLQQGQGRRQLCDRELIVIHGGSDKTKVCGDMWWFDLDAETWSEITTYGKDEEEGLTPINVSLVGQSMVNVGHISVSLGGFTQEEVDRLYLGKQSSEEGNDPNLKIGNDILNIFDLTTQCLQGHGVKLQGEGENRRPVLADKEPSKTNMVTSFGCQVLHTNGTIILIGGLISKRATVDEAYLRGTVLECVLPSISLAS